MISIAEFGLMSVRAYLQSADAPAPEPQGWQIRPTLSNHNDFWSGFSATVFHRAATNEYVVAFRGTDGLLATDLFFQSLPAAVGKPARQVTLAIRVVTDVLKAAAETGGTVTLTGHSLGGGLASIAAVFFDLDATTFATAPFENSVRAVPALLTMQEYYTEYWVFVISYGCNWASDHAAESVFVGFGGH